MNRSRESIEQDPQTAAIIGAAIEVHSTLKHGFLEPVYQAALTIELAARAIPFQREVELPVFYKGHRLGCAYRADFLCFEQIVVELKALPALTNTEQAQVLNYLRATGFHRALLLNFGASMLQIKRLVLGMEHHAGP
jgi:GxxExxY protein